MSCTVCGAESLPFPIPSEFRNLLPEDRPGASVCTNCLTVTPLDDPPTDLPNFTKISDAFPSEPDRALPVVLVLALLDSIALYREEIETLTASAEQRGVDVLLVLDRLDAETTLDPTFDLDRRREQLAQLLE